MIRWPHVLLGPHPNTLGLCSTSLAPVVPACSLFVFYGATHVFSPSELAGLSILTKCCYISYFYLISIYREENKLFSIYYSVLQ